MPAPFWNQFNPQARPAREQNLFWGPSRHLYFRKDGTVAFQTKPLAPKQTERVPVTRFVLRDLDTGTVYGECHGEESRADLLGFLLRAWSVKPHHPMRGIPGVLNVPRGLLADEDMQQDLEDLVRLASVQIGALPGGFAAGIHAVRLFEDHVDNLLRERQYHRKPRTSLELIQACSALLSVLATGCESNAVWEGVWAEVPPPGEQFLTEIGKLYIEPEYWRQGVWARVFE